MNRLIPAFGFLLFCVFQPQSVRSEWINIDHNSYLPIFTVENLDPSSLRIQLNLTGFERMLIPTSIGETSRISLDGAGITGLPGQPEIPVLRKLTLLPDRSDWHCEILATDFVEFPGYTLMPVQEEALETPNGSVPSYFAFDENAYGLNRWLPEEIVLLDRPIILRGFRLGRLELYPFQYNPARRTLRVFKSITFKISFSGEGDNPIRTPRSQKSRIFSSLIKKQVINPEFMQLDEDDEVMGGYLFITPPGLQSSLESQLVEWKHQKGFPCEVRNTNQTGTTASQIKSYIQTIYDTWPIPPDFLVLVGDEDYGMPTYYYPITNDASDLPYTLLEGEDYFPDMLAGRLSVDSGSELAVVCTKIRSYESNPYMTSSDWFTQGLMVYDYAGSLSCKNVKERCRHLMLEHGYTNVVQVSNPPIPGVDPIINNHIDNGVTFVNYRGYGGYTFWTPPYYSNSDIAQLNNGYKLPVVTSIVCGGGNFAYSSDPCFGEAWIRYGSTTNPKGAVGFVGPSSLYTHTLWNNCIDGGIYQGIFEEGIGDFGSAVLRGKMELYYGMPNNLGPGGTTNSVECYFYIYNILGDPGMEMWTGVPALLTVEHPDSLPLGINAFDCSVTANGQSVEGALVCIYKSSPFLQIAGFTDETGSVHFDLVNAPPGNYTVTVTGHNLKTYQGTLIITQQSVALGIDEFSLDDDMIGESSGDGDGQCNPGETIELGVILQNTGNSLAATGISGTLNTSDPFVTITQNTLPGPDVEPGALSSLEDDFNLVFSAEAPHSHTIPLFLTASCAQGSWTNLINLSIVAPLSEVVEYSVQNPAGWINPGEEADVTVTIMNSGGDPLPNCTGVLQSFDEELTVLDGYGAWGLINPGEIAQNEQDPFTLKADSDCPPGWVIPLQLIVTSGIYVDTLTLTFSVGRITESDPAGPDIYGYRCFDSRDTLYSQVPVYNWVEASVQPGQATLNLPDYGNEDDCSIVQALPFTFRYYGQEYDEIVVCSNGWIAMDHVSNYINARNWNIPGALGPPAMIAPFWDDLYLSSGSVHYWHDDANHRVVIEWNNARTAFGNGYNTFEIILHDPVYYPTSTGDGEIIFQYRQFQNYDASENYCTVGIENWQQSDGVKVTYANHYTLGSATLENDVALKFTTDIEYLSGVPDVEIALTPYGMPIQIPPSGGSFDFNIAGSNYEASAQLVTIWCDITLPNSSIYGPVIGPVTITLGANSTLDRDRTQFVPEMAPPGYFSYNAYIGVYPDSVWDSDSFEFIKFNDGDGEGTITDWINTGELFENELSTAQKDPPDNFILYGAYPNPFNPTTTIRFSLPEEAKVCCEIYSVQGRRVATLMNEVRQAGVQEATFVAVDLASGIYLVRLKAGGWIATGKILLMK